MGYRWWARERARQSGLSGFVRNLPDGTVEVEAAGPSVVLERFEAELAHGPPAARVTAVERREPTTDDLPEPFEIQL